MYWPLMSIDAPNFSLPANVDFELIGSYSLEVDHNERHVIWEASVIQIVYLYGRNRIEIRF